MKATALHVCIRSLDRARARDHRGHGKFEETDTNRKTAQKKPFWVRLLVNAL